MPARLRRPIVEWPRRRPPIRQLNWKNWSKTVDQLSNRAAAVNSGLDRLQQEQSASGYGLRGDMVERQASLKANLFKAEEAMQHHDAVRAKKYADMAGKDLEVLERFLGH